MERLLKRPSDQDFSISRREIIAWWEVRRLRFNLYVGIVGLASWVAVVVAGSAAVKPGVDFEEPIAMIIGPFIYGFLANVCYTLGWVVDTCSYRGAPRTGLYKVGTIFAVVLTALPGVWAVAAWIMTVTQDIDSSDTATHQFSASLAARGDPLSENATSPHLGI